MNDSTALVLTTGTASDGAGAGLATGDVNGDTIPDLIVGVPGQDKAYVLFGGKNFLKSGTHNLNTLVSQGLGLTLEGGSYQFGF